MIVQDDVTIESFLYDDIVPNTWRYFNIVTETDGTVKSPHFEGLLTRCK